MIGIIFACFSFFGYLYVVDKYKKLIQEYNKLVDEFNQLEEENFELRKEIKASLNRQLLDFFIGNCKMNDK